MSSSWTRPYLEEKIPSRNKKENSLGEGFEQTETYEQQSGRKEAEEGKVFGAKSNVSEQVSLWAKCN